MSRQRLILRICLGVGFPFAGLLVWELLSITHVLNAYFFPAPTRIAHDIVTLLGDASSLGLLLGDLERTIGDTLLGFGIGASLGVAIGAVMGSSRIASYLLGPTLYGTYPLPKVTLFPVFIVLFGLGRTNIVLLCALGTFYIVCIGTISGVVNSQTVFGEVAKTFKLPVGVRYRKVVLRAAWPSIANGLRLGIGGALVLVLVLEFIGSTTGMGAYIWNAWQQADVGNMFVGLVVIALLGGVLFVVGEGIERWATPQGRSG